MAKKHSMQFCAAILAIKEAPISALQLSIKYGWDEYTARGYVDALRDSGLIESAGWEQRKSGVKPVLWRWKS